MLSGCAIAIDVDNVQARQTPFLSSVPTLTALAKQTEPDMASSRTELVQNGDRKLQNTPAATRSGGGDPSVARHYPNQGPEHVAPAIMTVHSARPDSRKQQKGAMPFALNDSVKDFSSPATVPGALGSVPQSLPHDHSSSHLQGALQAPSTQQNDHDGATYTLDQANMQPRLYQPFPPLDTAEQPQSQSSCNTQALRFEPTQGLTQGLGQMGQSIPARVAGRPPLQQAHFDSLRNKPTSDASTQAQSLMHSAPLWKREAGQRGDDNGSKTYDDRAQRFDSFNDAQQVANILPSNYKPHPRCVPHYVKLWSAQLEQAFKTTPTGQVRQCEASTTVGHLKINNSFDVERALCLVANKMGQFSGLLPAADVLDRDATAMQKVVARLQQAADNESRRRLVLLNKTVELSAQVTLQQQQIEAQQRALAEQKRRIDIQGNVLAQQQSFVARTSNAQGYSIPLHVAKTLLTTSTQQTEQLMMRIVSLEGHVASLHSKGARIARQVFTEKAQQTNNEQQTCEDQLPTEAEQHKCYDELSGSDGDADDQSACKPGEVEGQPVCHPSSEHKTINGHPQRKLGHTQALPARSSDKTVHPNCFWSKAPSVSVEVETPPLPSPAMVQRSAEAHFSSPSTLTSAPSLAIGQTPSPETSSDSPLCNARRKPRKGRPDRQLTAESDTTGDRDRENPLPNQQQKAPWSGEARRNMSPSPSPLRHQSHQRGMFAKKRTFITIDDTSSDENEQHMRKQRGSSPKSTLYSRVHRVKASDLFSP